jgi:hypothetical protein
VNVTVRNVTSLRKIERQLVWVGAGRSLYASASRDGADPHRRELHQAMIAYRIPTTARTREVDTGCRRRVHEESLRTNDSDSPDSTAGFDRERGARTGVRSEQPSLSRTEVADAGRRGNPDDGPEAPLVCSIEVGRQ